jgi:hypothetical protein
MKLAVLAATFAAVMLCACSSFESTSLTPTAAGGMARGPHTDGVPITIKRVTAVYFVLAERTYRASGQTIVIQDFERTPIKIETEDVFTTDVRRPAAGTAKVSLALANQYPTNITTEITDNTIAELTKAVGEILDRVNQNGDQADVESTDTPTPKPPGTLVRQQFALIVVDPVLGTFTVRPLSMTEA